MNRKNVNMLEGSIWDRLLLVAIPLALTGMLQQLFNAADVAVVGRFVGSDAMAAVGCNTPIVGLIVNLFTGIALGTNVVIAKYTGMRSAEGITKAVHTSVIFAFFGGIIMTVVAELLAPQILTWISVPDSVFSMATIYLRIYLLGLPVIFLYNFESAIFRSQGDTRTPFIILTISGVINVALNLFFVCIVGMTVEGVALATVLSNVISSVVLFIFLMKREDYIRISLKNLHVDYSVLGQILKVGLPTGIQSAVFSISNIVIQAAINSLGADVIAASSAAFNVEIFVYYITNGFGQACTTFVGQNYGANNISRCKKVFWVTLGINMVFTMAAALGVLGIGEQVLGLFNTDANIIAIGMVRLRYLLYAEFLSVTMEVLSGTMRGFEYSLVPAIITFVGVCGSRIAWIYTVFPKNPTFENIMVIYPISWAITALALIITYILFIRRVERQTHE